MTRIKYKKATVVDGDTLKIVVKGKPRPLMTKYIRIVGIDTDEMKDPDPAKRLRAKRATIELERLMKKRIKPRLFGSISKSREGWPYFKNHNGRLLCTMMIWRWRPMGWHDFADHMIGKGLHKRGSKWNKGA